MNHIADDLLSHRKLRSKLQAQTMQMLPRLDTEKATSFPSRQGIPGYCILYGNGLYLLATRLYIHVGSVHWINIYSSMHSASFEVSVAHFIGRRNLFLPFRSEWC